MERNRRSPRRHLVMALIVFAASTAAYLLLGAEGAFREGSYEVMRR